MGRFGGAFCEQSPMKLMAELMAKLAERLGFALSESVEVLLGHCRQAGHGPNPARSAALWAGIPGSVPASTLNTACPSGLLVARLAAALHADLARGIVWCGGMDSMSTIPYLLKNCRFQGFKMGDRKLEDGWSDSRDPVIGEMMGETAERIVEQYGLTREEMDAYALMSHQRALAAREAMNDERIPLASLAEDETPRATSLEKLQKLPAAFGGKISAGNACSMADGAACYVLAHESRFPDQPCFRLMDCFMSGVAPELMGTGPGVAIRQAWQRNGFGPETPCLYEINEAFAAQILANLRDSGLTVDRINRRGGAIALGHPTGMSGARLLVTLMAQMIATDTPLGLATICGAGGTTGTAVLERLR
jgi:acetyl-CoA C-acetyltransferase